MSPQTQRRTVRGIVAVVAVAAAALIVVLGAVAGARTNRHVKTVALLSLPRGGFEVSLGDPPEWLPLSNTPQTLTLIAGAPARAGYAADNAYVGFTGRASACAATPADSGSPYSTIAHFFSAAHSGTHAGMFAPNGGVPKSSYIASVAAVVVHQTSAARACIWLARNIGASQTVTTEKPGKAGKPGKKKHKIKRAPRSLVASVPVPLLNHTFAASVSDLSGATPGNDGYAMYAIDGAHSFRYGVSTLQCGRRSSDGLTTIAAATPASESISLSASPCSTDASTFTFRGADINHTLGFPIADATANPPRVLKLGGCELDPLTGATLSVAEAYLSAVGCRVGQIEVTPYVKTLTRGAVAWASVDGGVAELAPAGTRVDLVLNGNPA